MSGFGTFNSERLEEFIDIMNKYKDPNTNVVDGNNPDYLAEVAALNQKYAPAQTQTQQQQAPAQTQTQQAPVQAQAQAQAQQAQASPQKALLYGGDGSLEKLIGGKPRFLTFQDPETGRTFNYDYEKQEYQGLGPDYYKADNLQIIGAMGEDRKKDGEFVSVSIDPDKFTYGGKQTPEQADKAAKEAAREPGYESGGGGLFYTIKDSEGNDTKYYTPDNSGFGIPVGAENITTDPIAAEKNITDTDNIEYVPVLSKGFDSYYDQNEQDAFKADMAKIPEKTKDLSFKNVFSITPGGGIIDTGFKNPFGDDTLKFSNPPSQLQNLGPFFNLAESFGYQNFKDSYNTDVLAKMLGKPQPQPKTVGELIKDVGGTSVAPPSTTKDPDPGIGGDDGGGGGDDPDPDKDKPKRTTFFAPAKRSDPISTAPDEPINTDPRFQPIFPQQPIQPIQPIGPIEGGPAKELFPIPTQPQASPAMPQPAPIPIEAKPTVMPPPQAVPPVLPPQTFADVMHRGGAKGPPGINPYFQDIEQINRTAPYTSIMGIATNPMMLKDGGGIMSLRNRMLMAPASQAMTKGIMS